MIIKSNILTYLLSFGFAKGITLFPFIFIKKECWNDTILINHEKIHLRQQIELLVIPFYVLYLLDFLFKLVIFRNFKNAYLATYFEAEAYDNQKYVGYLKIRRLYAYWRK